MTSFKKILISAAAAAGLCVLGGVAHAQTAATGTIGVNGTVGLRCAVISGGSGSSFSDTISLGELDDTSTGYLLTTLTGSTPSTAETKTFQVNCNGANATVDLKATRLNNAAGAAASGYAANIDYTTDLIVNMASGPAQPFHYTTQAAAQPDTTGTITGHMANAAGNVTVDVRSLAAEGGPTSILEAGSFTSTVTVSITPTT